MRLGSFGARESARWSAEDLPADLEGDELLAVLLDQIDQRAWSCERLPPIVSRMSLTFNPALAAGPSATIWVAIRPSSAGS